MTDVTDTEDTEAVEETIKLADVHSFKPVGRTIALEDLEGEFALMRDYLKKELTAQIAHRICEKSGTHLLKLVSPRTDGDHALLNVQDVSSNQHTRPLPSVNAADIPFAKVIYRPLEIMGHPTRCLVDDVLNPDAVSGQVLTAFAAVFGDDVLKAIQATLLGEPRKILKLAAGEFPIIFVPRPGGGDLQITPVSPATAFMGMKAVIKPFFEKQISGGPKVARGKFHKQAVSSKPQNISGAIGGPRTRLLAELPSEHPQFEAELYRFVRGGSFPRWREMDIDAWVLRYADMLTADQVHSDKGARATLDRTADRLIQDAEGFIGETLAEAHHMAEQDLVSVDPIIFKTVPNIGTVLLRRWWATEKDFRKARRALFCSHFLSRVQKHHDSKDTAP